MPPTDFDCNESESYDDICNKSNRNIVDNVSGEELRQNDLLDLIDNYDINKVSDQIIQIKKLLLINPDCTGNKSYDEIYDKSNRVMSDIVGSEELRSDDLENFK